MPRSSKSGSGRKRAKGSGIRWEKIARIRQEISRGTYDTPDKWEKILDRLLMAVQETPRAGRRNSTRPTDD